MNVSLLIIASRKVGQLGCVKLVPMPPSKGFGRGELVLDGAALRMEVAGTLEVGVTSVLEAPLLNVGAGIVLASDFVLAVSRRCNFSSGFASRSSDRSSILSITFPLTFQVPGLCRLAASVGTQSNEKISKVKRKVKVGLNDSW